MRICGPSRRGLDEAGSVTPGRARVRLLWDELLSPLVPQALAILKFKASHIGSASGSPQPPPRGSTDEDIVQYAKRTNQVIVTSNHEMLLICEQAGQRFVWIDPHGRKLSQREQVLLCLKQIEDWVAILGRSGGLCVRALRTKALPITPAEAARLAGQRMRKLERKRRARSRHPTQAGDQLDMAQDQRSNLVIAFIESRSTEDTRSRYGSALTRLRLSRCVVAMRAELFRRGGVR